jgi:hypothetical protein
MANVLDLRSVKGFKGRGLLHFAAAGGHVEVWFWLFIMNGLRMRSCCS